MLKKSQEIQQALIPNLLILISIVDRMLLYIEMTERNITINKSDVAVEKLYSDLLLAVSKIHDTARIERLGNQSISRNVNVDEGKMLASLLYIVENALTYSSKNTKVSIEFAVNNRTISIVITDRGYGIPKNEQKKIFSPFFRATNASLGINYGSGVSLFMAKKIIEMHGGTIQFTSKENEGSTFTINLPLA